jgi:hypothetical protein
MTNQRPEDFSVFYNHTIAPELMRLERSRMRLLGLLAFSMGVLAITLTLQFYLNILLVTLLISIPTALLMVYVLASIEQFRRNFKPKIVQLILDFVDDGLNFDPENPLRYEASGFLPQKTFKDSLMFVTPAHEYFGEDRIEGKVGEMFFELSELRVAEISSLRNQMNPVFQGVFCHALFNEPTPGIVIAWPRKRIQWFTRSVRDFTFQGGQLKDEEILHPDFRDIFCTYALDETPVAHILTLAMQEALVEFVRFSQKEFCFSFVQQNIYIALWSEKDMLEPHILRSNMSYARVREFFEDIRRLLYLVQIFDHTR